MPRDSSNLQTIPGVGKSLAADLKSLGIGSVKDLKGQDPQTLYDRLMQQAGGVHIDRCVLYVFRCAVYYAEHETHAPGKLQWWNWKDQASTR